MLEISLRWEMKKHEAVMITIVILLGIIFVSEITIDNGSCSKKNPNIDCGQRGLLNYTNVASNPIWTKTTGFGTHYITQTNPDSSTSFFAVPEFRNGFQHAVCDLNMTMVCEYHFDTYNALDFPFGTVLHLADTLTLYVGFLNEDIWQAVIWGTIFFSLYFTLRFIEHKAGR